jgi:hypothetical protein
VEFTGRVIVKKAIDDVVRAYQTKMPTDNTRATPLARGSFGWPQKCPLAGKTECSFSLDELLIFFVDNAIHIKNGFKNVEVLQLLTS